MRLITIFILLLSFQITMGQQKDSLATLESMNPYYSYKLTGYTPWGLVFVNDTLFSDYTEITIGEWLNYIYYRDLNNPILNRGKKLSEQKRKQLLTTEIDLSLLPTNEFITNLEVKDIFNKCIDCSLLRIRSSDGFAFLPFAKSTLNDKTVKKKLMNILKLPIAGISYEQASNYCKWRTTMDSLRWASSLDSVGVYSFTLKKWVNSRESTYIYRLPTPNEFDNMNPQFDSVYKSGDLIARFNYKRAIYSNNKSKQIENNLCGKKSMTSNHFQGTGTKKKGSYMTNIYNVQGNVAEMTSIKGTAKGGSYFHYANESYPKKDNYYSKPELWLGFRCIVEVRKR